MATEQPKFKSVPVLKEFLRERGIQTSLYRKEQLIKLAEAGVVIFPTGYGKSVCFQMVPLIHDAIYGGKHIGLVISPLIDQCQQTQKLGISSVCIPKKKVEMENHEIEGISNYLKSDSLPLLKLEKKKILKPMGIISFFF